MYFPAPLSPHEHEALIVKVRVLKPELELSVAFTLLGAVPAGTASVRFPLDMLAETCEE